MNPLVLVLAGLSAPALAQEAVCFGAEYWRINGGNFIGLRVESFFAEEVAATYGIWFNPFSHRTNKLYDSIGLEYFPIPYLYVSLGGSLVSALHLAGRIFTQPGWGDRNSGWPGDETSMFEVYPVDFSLGARVPAGEVGDVRLWVDLNARHVFGPEGPYPIGQGLSLGVRGLLGD